MKCFKLVITVSAEGTAPIMNAKLSAGAALKTKLRFQNMLYLFWWCYLWPEEIFQSGGWHPTKHHNIPCVIIHEPEALAWGQVLSTWLIPICSCHFLGQTISGNTWLVDSVHTESVIYTVMPWEVIIMGSKLHLIGIMVFLLKWAPFQEKDHDPN